MSKDNYNLKNISKLPLHNTSTADSSGNKYLKSVNNSNIIAEFQDLKDNNLKEADFKKILNKKTKNN